MQRPNLLTRAQAAQYLGVSPGTLKTWATRHLYDLPYRKVGRKVEYLLEDLEKFILTRIKR